MLCLYLLACNHDASSTPEATSEPDSQNTTVTIVDTSEHNQQTSPDIDFEWSSSEKTATYPDDTGLSLLMPNFSRTDINPFSSTYGAEISPQGYLETITGWYFIKATWGYCRGQFGLLNQLQVDLETNHPELRIQLLAINRTDVAVNEALATQYQMSLNELWTSFFGPDSPSQSNLPFVNDFEWAIWGSWGEFCTIEEADPDTGSSGTVPAHVEPADHWRDLYILNADS